MTKQACLGAVAWIAVAGCGGEDKLVTVPGEGCVDEAGPDSTTGADSTAETSAADTGSTDTIGGPDTVAGDAADDALADCAIKEGGNLCNTIPALSFGGVQIVDGRGDEFCDVPATVFRVRDGKPHFGATTVPALSTTLRARIAWSPLGVHAQFHVDDPEVVASNPEKAIGTGPGALDLVDFFIGGDAPFYGAFDNVKFDKGLYIQMSPPSRPGTKSGVPGFGELPASALVNLCIPDPAAAVSPGAKCNRDRVRLHDPAKFAGRLVTGGYELELFLPWTVLGRTAAPSKGAVIAANMAVAACDDPAGSAWAGCAAPKRAYTTYENRSVGTPTSCQPFASEPACDTRTWCAPTLE